MAVYELSVDQLIVFGQPGLVTNELGGFASDIFRMFETVDVNIKYLNAANFLNLGQNAIADSSIRNLQVFDFLAMSDRVTKGPVITVTQILSMWDSGESVLYEPVSQTLILFQRADAGFGKLTGDTIAFVDSATYNIVKIINVPQTLVMNSSATVWKPDVCKTNGSFPFGGVNGTPSEVF